MIHVHRCLFRSILVDVSDIVGCVQGKVIKTKSVEYMPFFLSLVSFLNGVCWTSYALIKFDLYVTVSNISIFRFQPNLI